MLPASTCSMMELFVHLRIGNSQNDVRKSILLSTSKQDLQQLPLQIIALTQAEDPTKRLNSLREIHHTLSKVESNRCKCYGEATRHRLLTVIETALGSLDGFDRMVRALICKHGMFDYGGTDDDDGSSSNEEKQDYPKCKRYCPPEGPVRDDVSPRGSSRGRVSLWSM